MTARSIRCLITVSCLVASGLLHAQPKPSEPDADDPVESPSAEEAKRLDKIVVTGSHIKRIDIEGPLPISVIDRKELLAAGEPSLSDAIRDLPYNSFGSLGDSPLFSAPNASLPSLRGLGSKYTLSLLDGHRLPGWALGGGGSAASISGIPLAAVDRIEILRDGASAVFGSDAIGGVINFLTRREDTAPEFELQYEQPEQSGGENRRASLTYGRSHERGHWLVAAQAWDRQPLYGADRDYLLALAGLFGTGNPGTYRRIDPETEDFVGGFQADSRCPTAVDTDPAFPSSARLDFGNNSSCGYRIRDLNAERAGFEGGSLFASGRYDLTSAVNGFARLLYFNGDGLSQAAPTPVRGLFIGADNPFNPTRGELGEELGFPLLLRYRITSLGPRITESNEHSLHALAGVEGLLDWGQGGDWSVSVSHNRYDQSSSGVAGHVLAEPFQAAVDSGRFNPFAAVANDPRGLESAIYEPTDRSQSRANAIELALSLDADAWAGVTASYAFGLDLRRDEFATSADPESTAGRVLGRGEFGEPQSAARSFAGVYGEMLLPLSERWEASLAARYDHYQDAGGAFSPKLAVAYRPSEYWLLRTALGRGFQAPDLAAAYGGSVTFEGFEVDAVDCALRPQDDNACRERPIEVSIVPNDQLGPERAKQGSIGAVWQVLDSVELALDYYRTEVSGQIGNLDAEAVLELELECLQTGRVCDPILDGQVIRDPLGNISAIIIPRINIAGLQTEGIDLELSARRETRVGTFSFDLRASKVLDFDVQISPTIAFGIVGAFGAPPWRSQARLNWQFGQLGGSVGAEYVAERGDCAPARFADGTPNPDCEDRIGSHTEFDAQWRWQASWGGELTLGGRNLANRPPPHNLGGDYQYGLYDPNGRVWYLRYRHAF